MREYRIEIEIGGYVRFEYVHRASEVLEQTGQDLANSMDDL